MKTSNIVNKFLMLIIIMLISCGKVCCADQSVNSTLKVGIIGIRDLENCLYAKEIRRKLEKEFSPKNDKLINKQKELQNKTNLLERDKAVLSDKERASRDMELTKLQQEVQHMAESLEVETRSRLQEELINFNKVVDEVINKLAETEKYDLILPDQVVKFNKDSMDCTAKVVAALDAKFKAKK